MWGVVGGCGGLRGEVGSCGKLWGAAESCGVLWGVVVDCDAARPQPSHRQHIVPLLLAIPAPLTGPHQRRRSHTRDQRRRFLLSPLPSLRRPHASRCLRPRRQSLLIRSQASLNSPNSPDPPNPPNSPNSPNSPHLPTKGRLWEAVGSCGELRRAEGSCGRLSEVVGGCGGLWGVVGGCGGLRGEVGSCGKLWGAAESCGVLWGVVVDCDAARPQPSHRQHIVPLLLAIPAPLTGPHQRRRSHTRDQRRRFLLSPLPSLRRPHASRCLRPRRQSLLIRTAPFRCRHSPLP